jgi:hypothetical protein
MKQLGLAMVMYTQDYDEKFPRITWTNGQTWDMLIVPYVKSDQVFICPSGYRENTRSYTMNTFLAGWTNYPGAGWPVPTELSLSGIPRPSNTVLLIEESDPENSLGTYNLRGKTTSSVNSGGTTWAHRTGAVWGNYTGLTRNSSGSQIYGVGTGVHINDTFVVTFADGHVKPVKAGPPPQDGSFLWSPYGTNFQ